MGRSGVSEEQGACATPSPAWEAGATRGSGALSRVSLCAILLPALSTQKQAWQPCQMPLT